MTTPVIEIGRRFCGPPNSANGGYACGRLADFLDAPATIRLMAPPPMDTPMNVVETAEGVDLMLDERCIARAYPGVPPIEAPSAPDRLAADAAARRFAGFEEHVFPGCFVCGTEREDGLNIYAGALEGSDSMVAPWTPGKTLDDGTGRVREEYLWSALDCPGAFVCQPKEIILLGELSARIEAPVEVGEPCTVLA